MKETFHVDISADTNVASLNSRIQNSFTNEETELSRKSLTNTEPRRVNYIWKNLPRSVENLKSFKSERNSRARYQKKNLKSLYEFQLCVGSWRVKSAIKAVKCTFDSNKQLFQDTVLNSFTAQKFALREKIRKM